MSIVETRPLMEAWHHRNMNKSDSATPLNAGFGHTTGEVPSVGNKELNPCPMSRGC